jgi:hypothetical protein
MAVNQGEAKLTAQSNDNMQYNSQKPGKKIWKNVLNRTNNCGNYPSLCCFDDPRSDPRPRLFWQAASIKGPIIAFA